MLLLTLPFWFLVLLAGLVVLGVVLRAGRRYGWFGTTSLFVFLVILVQATWIPKAMWSVGWYLGGVRPLLEDVDFLLSRAQRAEVVRRAEAGLLSPSLPRYARDQDFALPDGFTGLSQRGDVWVRRDDCGTLVFFMVITGFSPDPYGGFEFAPTACEPELDPLGSGMGRARALGDGWYWIDAS